MSVSPGVLRMERKLEVPAEDRARLASSAGVALRTADVAEDAPGVYALLELVFGDNAPYAEWLAWWTQDPEFDPSLWFLAEAGGELAGAALCWSSAFVKDLAVHPAHRRLGIGRALLLRVFEEFRSRGAPAVTLKVDADNADAVRLYRAAGMTVVERIA